MQHSKMRGTSERSKNKNCILSCVEKSLAGIPGSGAQQAHGATRPVIACRRARMGVSTSARTGVAYVSDLPHARLHALLPDPEISLFALSQHMGQEDENTDLTSH